MPATLVFRPATAAAPRGRTATLSVRAAQSLTGKVVSKGAGPASATVVVEVDRFPPHPLYSKRIRSTTRYQAHDAEGKANLGDIVRLDPVRPMSKTKRFAVAEVVKAGE